LTSYIYTLSLHDALPILRLFLLLLIFVTSMSCSSSKDRQAFIDDADRFCEIHKLTSWEQGGRLEALNQLDPTEKLEELTQRYQTDRKSTRLNSSHVKISY